MITAPSDGISTTRFRNSLSGEDGRLRQKTKQRKRKRGSAFLLPGDQGDMDARNSREKEKTPGAIEATSLGVRGADSQNRTGDLILTKDALYRLSYISMLSFDNDGIIPQQNQFCKRFFGGKQSFLMSRLTGKEEKNSIFKIPWLFPERHRGN